MVVFSFVLRKINIPFRFLIISFFSIVSIQAQTPEIEYLGIENGLSNNAVTSIYQDYKGFMWFGTYDGLNRYDGYEFKVFRNVIGDTNSLHFNHVTAIAGDAYHNIWVGGQKGVSIFNQYNSDFSAPEYFPANSSTPIKLDDDVNILKAVAGNYMLVGTQHTGLFVYSGRSRTTEQIPLHLPKGTSVGYDVTAIEFDSVKQVVYVFVRGAGLCIYDVSKQTLKIINGSIKQATCIKIDRNRNCWVGTDEGLTLYDMAANSFSKDLIHLKSRIINICIDEKNVLWIATDGGGVSLLTGPENAPVPLFTATGNPLLNSNAVYAIYEDIDGRKWIGTLRGGINVIESRRRPFKQVIYETPGKSNSIENFILSFCADEKNNVWIGTDGAGLRFWNRQKNTFTSYSQSLVNKNSISSNFITSIERDHRNDIWISTWFGGINKLQKSTNSFTRYTCVNPKTGLAENNVWMMYEDSKKRLWASATNDGSLYLFNRVADRFELFDEKITNLQSLTEDREGNLWGGNYSSLIKIDTRNKKHITYNVGYPVRCIHEDKDHNFWVGTQDGGLLLVDRKTAKFRRFTRKDGLPGNTILRLLEDGKGNLWMSTFNGLSKFNPRTKQFRNFSQSDGLQSNQFSFKAGLALPSGEFLFGGIKGFNIFYPDSVYERFKEPKLFLTGLKINNIPIEEDDSYVSERKLDQVNKVTLPFDRAVLSLDFVALEFSATDKIKYAYYLEGWDNDWNYVNNIRTATYSRLVEGNYVFKIKVSNPDGKWSNETQLLKITVLPPWYRTWWAYLIYFLIGTGAIYLYLLFKNRQAKLQYQIKVAHVEAEKEKELNEKKMLFFTNISHEFRTPLSLIINPIKDILHKNGTDSNNHELNIVYRNARRLLRLVDQLLLFRKADSEMEQLNLVQFDLHDLCREVYSYFIQQAKTKKISYELECNSQPLIISADREKIEIALFNILSNALKYTPKNGKVHFQVVDFESDVKITISDTGIGIPAETGDKLFGRFYQVKENMVVAGGFGIGLNLVKNFVEAHQGRVSYKSEKGRGTAFFVVLPKNTGVANADPYLKNIDETSVLLQELNEEESNVESIADPKNGNPDNIVSDRQSVLIIDDDDEIRQYLVKTFSKQYKVYEASDGEGGIQLAHQQLPDIIISDVVMKGIGGIDLCKSLKADSTVSHIPVILLTGSTSDKFELEGIESGAEDYIKKPFDKDILTARVTAILKGRNTLQKYFYNEITLQSNNLKVSVEYKEFLEKCIQIVEEHLDDENFSIKTLATEIGMSHSNLYKKVKSVSGQSVNSFIRFIRLRKAASILINTENNINQTASMVGFNDIKYFREQFNKVFGMNPSEYVRKFRKPFHNIHHLDEKGGKPH